MARQLRFCPPGIPQHVIQRGNNRGICFADDGDFAAYATWLKEYSQEFQVAVHAWVFMSNHVHLLVTPDSREGLSLMMQALGRRYVRHFNFKHQRTGTLWEGRFRSSLVQSKEYLLHCYRYIELNPVRANMVAGPADYRWSSYHCNGQGIHSDLCTPHEEYLRLGGYQAERLLSYRALFQGNSNEEMADQIRHAINTGFALGNPSFTKKIEQVYGRRITAARLGRPQKSLI